MLIRSLLFVAAIVTSLVAQATAQDKSIVVASTTSTQDSGLLEYLLPIFKHKTGIDVKVVAQGTGRPPEHVAPLLCAGRSNVGDSDAEADRASDGRC